ncbi:hypothetical protein L3Q82_002227 [Scortum barcoo]|uniref:Uncharacterized protein n=1 Tax=Scortum barcoo TaxID=214431 RepID=A0ACB8W2J7_9TELE|nr:hypothetical protein L3Q82_002227 [Scortum barcoo]
MRRRTGGEVASLVKWCGRNNLSLNTDKTEEMVLDMRRERRQHQPLMIRDSEVKCVSSFKLLGVHICDDLTWTLNITQLVKKAHQRLYFLRRLRKFWDVSEDSEDILHRRHREHPDQLHHGNSTAADCKRLQRAVRTAERIVRCAAALSAGHQPPAESTGEPAAPSETPTPPTPSTHSAVFCPLAGAI